MSDVDGPQRHGHQEREQADCRSRQTRASVDAEQTGERSPADAAVGSGGLVLIDKLLRGELTDREGVVLAKLLKESAELRAEYRSQAEVHSALLWSSGKVTFSEQSVDPIAMAILINEAEQAARAQALQDAKALASEVCPPEPTCDDDVPKSPRWRSLAWFAGGTVAAALLLALTLASPQQTPPVAQEEHTGDLLPDPLPVPPPVVAKLQKSRNAVWTKSAREAGDRGGAAHMSLPPGALFRETDRYYLHRGYASFTTLAGAAVSVESPCEIEFVGANHIRLLAGKVLGECSSSESRGFVVDTPTRRIVDLGTEFGVWLKSDGSLFTEVFEGRVATSEITTKGAVATVRELVQDQALTIDTRGLEASAVRSLDGSPFNQLAAERMGVVKQTDGIVFLSHPPQVITNGALRSEKGLFVIEELRSGFTLPVDLGLTFQDAGNYDVGFEWTQDAPTLPAGVAIRSYIIHVDCTSEGHEVRQGKLTFDGDILGVIANPEQWNEFVAIAPDKACRLELGLNETTLIEGHLNRKNETLRDSIRLTEDRRSIEFSLCVSGRAFDSARVIVSMPESP